MKSSMDWIVWEMLEKLKSDRDIFIRMRDEAKAILLYDGKNLSAIEYLSRESEFYALLYSSLKPKEEEPSSPETEEEESNNTDTL